MLHALGAESVGQADLGGLSGSWSREEGTTAGGAGKADGGQSGQCEERLCPSVEDFRAQRERRTLEILVRLGVKRGHAGARGEEVPTPPTQGQEPVPVRRGSVLASLLPFP